MSNITIKQCPFCGSNSARVNIKQVAFLGQNEVTGAKKLKCRSYVVCNKCHSRGKPITFIGITKTGGYPAEASIAEERVIEAWNKRTVLN